MVPVNPMAPMPMVEPFRQDAMNEEENIYDSEDQIAANNAANAEQAEQATTADAGEEQTSNENEQPAGAPLCEDQAFSADNSPVLHKPLPVTENDS